MIAAFDLPTQCQHAVLGFKYFSVATLRVESESDFEVIKEMEIESDLVRSENSLKIK